MARSIGLTLYNLRPPQDGAAMLRRPDRPVGRLVWLHAPSVDAAATVIPLARRLVDEDGVLVLLTCPAALAPQDGIILEPPPRDTPAEARSFLDHWRPEVALFTEGELRPAILDEARSRGIPLLMADGRAPYLLRERKGWYPGLIRSALAGFSDIVAVDGTAARAFQRAGAPTLRTLGRMEEAAVMLPCLEAERAALAKLLSARPLWFAAALPEEEETAIIEAHVQALGLAHRLLMIVAPQDPDRVDALAQRMEDQHGWIVARRSMEEEPMPETEVYLVDAAEYGLWYRLAPITFLGGSLNGKGALRTPLEAAAFGSAILHGPRPGDHGATFDRLGAARATRAVATTRDLAEAISDLLSPDRAARLAQAAWTVASDGAEVTHAIHDRIRAIMDGDA